VSVGKLLQKAMSEKNTELLRRWYEEVVSTGAVEGAADFVSPGYVEVHDNVRYPIGLEIGAIRVVGAVD
jgi:hypothetical protein